MKTLVSAKAKRLNPWLVSGHVAWIIPAILLVVWYVYGWVVMVATDPDLATVWQSVSAIYAVVMSMLLVVALVFGATIFLLDGYHKDVYNWWRNKVENYGKIED